jgi:multisubunit Na+/H+ antiporter MnhB subunit
MRTSLKLTIVALLAAVGLVTSFFTPAFAACTSGATCVESGLNSTGGTGGGTEIGPIIKLIINALLFILGAVAVIMIVIGGIRYTISQGDSGAVTSAKNTILYSVIGLVVALLAYAIVNFVIDQFTSSTGASKSSNSSKNSSSSSTTKDDDSSSEADEEE